jgi:hypothetical protein
VENLISTGLHFKQKDKCTSGCVTAHTIHFSLLKEESH